MYPLTLRQIIHLPPAIPFLSLIVGLALTMPLSRAAADKDDADSKPAAVDKDSSRARSESGAAKKEGVDAADQIVLAPRAVKRYGIALGAVSRHKLISHLIVPARLAFNSLATAVVGSAVQGRVADIKVNVGDMVKKGDELLIVESPELGLAQSDYLLKRTGIVTAQAAVGPAKAAYERGKSLYDSSQGIALGELQKRDADYKAVQNALLTAQAMLKEAQSKLGFIGMSAEAIAQLANTGQISPRYAVRSPLAGTVTERDVTLGELVKPDQPKLLVVSDMSTLWVLADVPESRIRDVAIGARATVTLPAMGDASYDAKVSRIGLSVDPATRTIRVQIDVKNDATLKPGMFAEADIVSTLAADNGDEATLAVPASAILTVDGTTAVFVPVKGKENTFAKRLISVGNSAGGFVAIVSGLTQGKKS
ncbi:MAG TPA: efflux RND transporter periplasmic adaptor subunit [Tepidisphaeraceae bacterium]|nr:efflux RND transporter periplasmic adaptor subunit [Tepidisphaeraceae bacterium]